MVAKVHTSLMQPAHRQKNIKASKFFFFFISESKLLLLKEFSLTVCGSLEFTINVAMYLVSFAK